MATCLSYLMQITFLPSVTGLHTAKLNVFGLPVMPLGTSLSSNGDRRQKVSMNPDMLGCTFQASVLLKAVADQPSVQVKAKLNITNCSNVELGMYVLSILCYC